jgi:hypothetical protein
LGYAVRKKKRDVLQAQKSKFVERAAERGVPPNIIDAVFKAFEPFERYGFNKAHATCYGLIAYQTAYLKANYTVEYMTSVLTAVRDSSDKVAAAIAECRRLGIEVRPPDVHASGLDFSVETDAIRFGLLAIKNVGHGAIESIVAARTEGGPFRSLADFCNRIDLRLVNRRVLESLIKVGALNALGHPAQLLLALDDALAAGQAAQRDRLTGQVSLFDMTPDVGAPLERALPEGITEAAPRERLRWEKELLGLYLSDHPLGELAGTIGDFVNAYSGEMGEELDQQRVCVGGVVTGVRRVITKARATMGVATLEDLQGTMEVIVFPKVFEQTEQTWAEDAILLVAGRVDHKGDETVLLAEQVWTWEEASAMGSGEFARRLSALERGRRSGRVNGNGHAPAEAIPVGPGGGNGDVRAAAPRVVRTVPLVSPLRGGGVTGTIAVAFPAAGRGAPRQAPDVAVADDEPPLPEEVVAELRAAEQEPTLPVQAAAGQALHVTFEPGAQDQVLAALRELREIVHDRPGDTPLVLHIPAGGGRVQRMELRVGVAYDAELLALITRRLGLRQVRLALA